MSVAIVRQGKILGEFTLKDGVAVPDPSIQELARGLVIRDASGVVLPSSGERYLAALPQVLTGPVLWAEPVAY